MVKTVTVCSWILGILGFCTLLALYPEPIGFIAYIILFLAISRSRRLMTRFVVLPTALAFVLSTFWFRWDLRFVHLSTVNNWPLIVDIAQLVVAVIGWLVVRFLEKPPAFKTG